MIMAEAPPPNQSGTLGFVTVVSLAHGTVPGTW